MVDRISPMDFSRIRAIANDASPLHSFIPVKMIVPKAGAVDATIRIHFAIASKQSADRVLAKRLVFVR